MTNKKITLWIPFILMAFCKIGLAVLDEDSLVAGKLLTSIDLKVQRWMNNAAIQTNNIASDLVNQVDAMRRGIITDVDFAAEKRINQLSHEMQNRINALNRAVISLEKEFTKDLTGIARETSLSIRKSLWEIPFVGENVAVSYIDGTFVPYVETGEHILKIQGHNIGFDSARYKISTQLLIDYENGTRDNVKGIPISESVSEFNIGMKNLLQHRHKKNIQAIDATIAINVVKVRKLWWNKKMSLSIPVRLVLSPNFVATITGKISSKRYSWKRNPSFDFRFTHNTPSGHPNAVKHNTGVTRSVSPFHNPPLPGDKRIIKASRIGCSSIDQACYGWQVDHGCTVEGSGESVKCSITNWSHSLNLTYKAQVEEYAQVEDATESIELKILNSQPFQLSLPSDFYSISLIGEMADGRKFTIRINRTQNLNNFPDAVLSSNAPVIQISSGMENGKVVYTFEALRKPN